MSLLTDDLLQSLGVLLRSGASIPASDLRAFQAQMIAAIAVLEARDRGNTIHYASGTPDDALGQEGDLGVNVLNGDVFRFTGGTFVFLFNLLPRGTFDPFEVPLELRDWVADPVRRWFGPDGGEAIYTEERLPAGAVAGMNWDDPDANVEYVIKPVAFLNDTVIVCQRKALLAP